MIDFEAFWMLWPKKVARGDARKAWSRAILSAKPEEILAGLGKILPIYEKMLKSERRAFVPYPATWLNREQWADETGPEGERLISQEDRDKSLVAIAEWRKKHS